MTSGSTSPLRTAGSSNLITDTFEFGPNILTNASFETLDGERPAGWDVRTYTGTASHRVADLARTGKHSLQISSLTGSDTSWFTKVKLKANTMYRLSGWIRTDKVGGATGACLNMHALQRAGLTRGLKKKNDWTRVEKVFNSGRHTEESVNLLFGGWGKSRGTAYYDDVALEEMTPIYKEAEKVTIVPDAGRGKKIFHEHQLASCIRCHVLDGKGGPVGPALDGIASRKNEDYLRQSMRDPQAVIAEGFPAQVSPMPPMGVILIRAGIRRCDGLFDDAEVNHLPKFPRNPID